MKSRSTSSFTAPDLQPARAGSMPSGRYMSWPAAAIGPATRCDAAFRTMRRLGVRHLLIGGGDEPLLGVLCQADLRNATGHRAALSLARSVPMVAASTPIQRTTALLRSSGSCCACVIVSRDVSGIITRGDLIRAGLDPHPGVRCASCGDHHRVHHRLDGGCAFCPACLDAVESRPFDELYIDVGGGD